MLFGDIQAWNCPQVDKKKTFQKFYFFFFSKRVQFKCVFLHLGQIITGLYTQRLNQKRKSNFRWKQPPKSHMTQLCLFFIGTEVISNSRLPTMVYILQGLFLKGAWFFSDCISFRQRLNSNIVFHLLIYSYFLQTFFKPSLNARHSAGDTSIKKAKNLLHGVKTSPSSFLFYAIPWKRSRIFFPPSSFLLSFPSFFLSLIFLFLLFLIHSFVIQQILEAHSVLDTILGTGSPIA